MYDYDMRCGRGENLKIGANRGITDCQGGDSNSRYRSSVLVSLLMQ